MLDASTFVGPWAFRDVAARTVTALRAELRPLGVKGMAVSPIEAILHPEPMAANRRLLAAVRQEHEPGFAVTPVPILDPSLPTWPEHLEALVHEGAGVVRAVKIVPNYHTYQLSDTFVHDLAQALVHRNLGLCIQVRMVDERSHHPLMKVEAVASGAVAEFAAAHPNLKVLVCGAYMSELATYKHLANVGAEMSFVESGATLTDALRHLDANRLFFGTHAPLHYPAVGVSKLWSDEVTPGTFAQLSEGNFKAFYSASRRDTGCT